MEVENKNQQSNSPVNAGKIPMRIGYLILVPLLLVFVGWSILAPLDSAAIAMGNVVLDLDRKTVQHLEGGIVENVLVEEGQLVEKGNPILIIRDIAQRAQINALFEQLAAARANYARLSAEYQELEQPDFGKVGDNINLADDKILVFTALQYQQFETRKSSILNKNKIIHSAQQQTRKEIVGLNAQVDALDQQIAVNSQELDGISKLIKKGFAPVTRKLELQKLLADLEGKVAMVTANIAQLEQSILAADLQIIDSRREFQESVLNEMQELDKSIQNMGYQLIEMRDQLKRTIIRAPANGRILGLQVHTDGAVITPGEKILDIVPQDDRLIVEAKLNPNDIDLVKPGTKAKVLLSAYKAKKVPKLDGEVESVSGDILVDQVTGQQYFLVRIVVDDSIFKNLKHEISLYPGMPVQVFLIEGERTFAQYILSPIIDATYRSMREE